MTRPDGSFGGIVSGTVLLTGVRQRFDSVHLGMDGAITLFRDDGLCWRATLAGPDMTGRDLEHRAAVLAYQGQGASGTFWAIAQSGRRRPLLRLQAGGQPSAGGLGRAFRVRGGSPRGGTKTSRCVAVVYLPDDVAAAFSRFVALLPRAAAAGNRRARPGRARAPGQSGPGSPTGAVQ